MTILREVCHWFCRTDVVQKNGNWNDEDYFSKVYPKVVAGPKDSWMQQLQPVGFHRGQLQLLGLVWLLKSVNPKVRPLKKEESKEKFTNYIDFLNHPFFEEVDYPFSSVWLLVGKCDFLPSPNIS